MRSPADEIAVSESPGRAQDAEVPPARATAKPEASDFGPDEERLVQQARADAVLRLARAH